MPIDQLQPRDLFDLTRVLEAIRSQAIAWQAQSRRRCSLLGYAH